MSWPLASFSLVAGVLLVGWLAYERSMPSARTVAIVATLSALAALGRDAFTALDEVKPITAMAFAIGYAMGPLPGFVVGAVGMLVSNIVLGQGPYTPWQMAAWGIVGLLGALAGKLFKGRVSRVPLALGCAFAALVAKEIMNLYLWSIGGVHTLPAFFVWAWSSLPFDVVDVVSTFLFGLAFGPELVRILRRAQTRMTVRWEGAGAAGAVALALVGVGLGDVSLRAGSARAAARAEAMRAPSGEAVAQRTPGEAAVGQTSGVSEALISREVSYLAGAQNADGGFGAEPHGRSTGMYTAWAAIGLAAAGKPPLSLRKDGHDLLSVLGSHASSLEDAGDIERTMLALHACGLHAGRLGGKDLLAALIRYQERDGSFEGRVNSTAFAILALRAAGQGASTSAVSSAAHWLSAQQNGDGGFSFGTKGSESDVDDTGAAMEAIVAAGVSGRPRAGGHSGAGRRHGVSGRPNARLRPPLARAAAYLRSAQNADGGFPQMRGAESNAQSTAWAVQGLIAAGRLGAPRRSPIAYLERLIAPNGSIRYAKGNPQTPVWVTAQAVAALAGRALPVGAPRDARARSVAGSGVPRAQLTGAGPRESAAAHGVDAIAARCLAGMRGLLG